MKSKLNCQNIFFTKFTIIKWMRVKQATKYTTKYRSSELEVSNWKLLVFLCLVIKFYDFKWKISSQILIFNQKILSKVSAFWTTAVCLHFGFSFLTQEPLNIQKCYGWLWIAFFLLNKIGTYQFLKIFWFGGLISKNVIQVILGWKTATPLFLSYLGYDTQTEWTVGPQNDMERSYIVSFTFQKSAMHSLFRYYL